MKTEVTRRLENRKADIVATKSLPRGQKTSSRLAILQQVIAQSVPVITPIKVDGFCAHSEALVEVCLETPSRVQYLCTVLFVIFGGFSLMQFDCFRPPGREKSHDEERVVPFFLHLAFEGMAPLRATFSGGPDEQNAQRHMPTLFWCTRLAPGSVKATFDAWHLTVTTCDGRFQAMHHHCHSDQTPYTCAVI